MEDNEMLNEKNGKEDLFSKAVKAGKRTYFFDVKATKNEEKYLTITESKRRFDNETNRFVYEKHKIFLYKEDFEKVSKALSDAIRYVETGEYPEDYNEDTNVPQAFDADSSNFSASNDGEDSAIDKWFDELEKN